MQEARDEVVQNKDEILKKDLKHTNEMQDLGIRATNPVKQCR